MALASRDGHIVVLVAVEDVDAVMEEVAGQLRRLARVVGPDEHLLDRRGVFVLDSPAVRGEAPPARARGDGRPELRHGRPDLPGPVAAHGMAGEVDPGRVRREEPRRFGQDLERVEPAPVLPVESVGTAVGRRDDPGPVLGLVGPGLPDGLDARAVERQEEGRSWPAMASVRPARLPPGCDAEILDAAVDPADERARVMGRGRDGLELDLERRRLDGAPPALALARISILTGPSAVGTSTASGTASF